MLTKDWDEVRSPGNTKSIQMTPHRRPRMAVKTHKPKVTMKTRTLAAVCLHIPYIHPKGDRTPLLNMTGLSRWPHTNAY